MVASLRNILCPTILSKADENRLKMRAELIRKHYPKDFMKNLDYGMLSSVNEYRDEISTFICLILGSYFSSAFSDLHKLLICLNSCHTCCGRKIFVKVEIDQNIPEIKNITRKTLPFDRECRG